MHRAIQCSCQNILVFDAELTTVVCPRCERRFSHVPRMFCEDGTEAKHIRYAHPNMANTPIDDATVGMLATAIRDGLEGRGSLDTFSLIYFDGSAMDIPLNLKDFGAITNYGLKS